MCCSCFFFSLCSLHAIYSFIRHRAPFLFNIFLNGRVRVAFSFLTLSLSLYFTRDVLMASEHCYCNYIFVCSSQHIFLAFILFTSSLIFVQFRFLVRASNEFLRFVALSIALFSVFSLLLIRLYSFRQLFSFSIPKLDLLVLFHTIFS